MKLFRKNAELVSYMLHDGKRIMEWRCPNKKCGFRITENFFRCPNCSQKIKFSKEKSIKNMIEKFERVGLYD